MSKKAARRPERLRHWLAPVLTLALGAALPGAALAQAGEDAPSDVEEIIVTATKREQSIQDVPIAVSAFAGEDLQARGIAELEDLQQISPSISVYSSNSSSNGGTLRIRGMGTTGNNPGLESAVGSFIDGVYRSRSGQVYSDFVDVERIEILRGPQGTLFGKNTSAGAVQLITKQPEFDQGGNFGAEFGDFDHFKFSGGITGPINDELAFRFSGSWFNREGYYENVETSDAYDNRDRYALRGQLLWKPDENTEFRIIGDYNEKDESCCPAAFHAPGPSAGIVRALGGYVPGAIGSNATQSRTTNLRTPHASLAAFAPLPTDLSFNLQNPQVTQFEAQSRKVGLNFEPVEDVEDYGVQMEATWDVRGATLTAITAYREFDAFRAQDIDFTSAKILRPTNAEDEFETLSQELRVTGTTGPVDWLVGIYGYYEDIATSEEVRFDEDGGRFFAYAFGYSPDDPNPVIAGTYPVIAGALPDGAGYGAEWGQETTGFAFFTNNTYHATEQLDVTLGLRWSSETKDAFGYINGGSPGEVVNEDWCNMPAALTSVRLVVGSLCDNVSWQNSESETEWTGTLSASYSLTDDLNSYLSYSRGYKAGGYNLDQEAYDSIICWNYGGRFDGFGNQIGSGPGQTPDAERQAALTAAGQTPPGLTPTSGGSRFEVVGTTDQCEGKEVGDEAYKTDNTRFDPEFADSLEAGLKGTFLGGALTVNSAVFYTEYEDFQLNTFNGLGFVISNVSEVDSWGVEVEAFWNLMEGLFATFGVTYADTTYGDSARDSEGRQLANLLDAPTGGNIDHRVVAQGKRITHAPAWQGSASVYYEAPVNRAGWLGFLSTNLSYRGRHNTGSNLHPIKVEKAYTLLNAQVGVRSPDGLWEAVLWGNNLRNKFVNTLIFDSVFQSGSFHTFFNQPRMWGLTLRYRFGADAL